MGTTLKMPKGADTRELIEGHPIGVRKIIQGDLREKSWVVEGQTYVSQHTDGVLLYDSQENRNRPWFILDYESGNRYTD